MQLEDVEHGSGPPGRDAGPRRGRRASGRRRPGLVVGAVVLSLAVVVASNAVEQRRLADRVAAYAALPGTVPALDRPLTEAWSVQADGVWRAGHLVLVGDGSAVRAVDASDGREVWTLERAGTAPVQRCLADREAERSPVVVCVRGRIGGGPPGTGTHVALDAAGGSVLGEHPARPASHGPVVTGRDVVTAEPGEDDSLVVVRARAVDRTPIWVTRVPLDGGRQAGADAGTLRVENGFVVLGGSTTAVLDADDGRVLGAWYPGGYTAVGSVPGLDGADVRTAPDGFGAWDQSAAGARGQTGTWFDRTGEPAGMLEGVLLDAPVTDGSQPDVRLTARTDTGELLATDLVAARELWRVPARGALLLVRREGAVVVAGGDQVRSLDLRSGAVRWSVAVPGLVARSGSVTDGATAVVVAEARGRAQLVALDLDTGVVRWEAPAPGVAPLSERRHDFPHVALGEVAGRPVLLGDGLVVGLS